MAEEPETITHEAVRSNPSEEWFVSIFGVDGQQHYPEARSKHRIPKAPAKFREYEKDKKHFDPRVVSLGPYHHSEDHLKPMEKHKITAAKQFADDFISQNGERGTIYEKFMDLARELRECYVDEMYYPLTDDVFARMMFLDACFVLHFIDKITEGGTTKLEISNDVIPLIIRDMFLIENQLPFEFLDALLNLRWGSRSSVGKLKIMAFISSKVLLPMGFYSLNSSRSFEWCVVDGRPLHLLDILRTILLGFPPSKGTKKERYRPRNFGSVVELEETMIRIEKRRMESLMDISYKEHLLFPRLLLPTMFINDTTISQLLNLTALEACFDTYSGCGVTSYINLIDSLINHVADVKELRSMGILQYHALGSDDELARLFKQWPADVTNDLKLYSDISAQMRLHHKRKVKISIAKWWDHYFGTSWTAMSFVGAGLLLVLSGIQTYFAAFPRR